MVHPFSEDASACTVIQQHKAGVSLLASLVLWMLICILTVQGEREFVKDNKSLGNFRLDGIPSAPRGVPQVEVKFDIDANGILSVTATDKGTGKKQDIKITGASTLGGDEVDRMVTEAEKYAEEDKARREAVDTKNQVRAMQPGRRMPGTRLAQHIVLHCIAAQCPGSFDVTRHATLHVLKSTESRIPALLQVTLW